MLTTMQLIDPLVDEVAEVINDGETISDRKRDTMYAMMGLITKINGLSLVDAMGILDVVGKVTFNKQQTVTALKRIKVDGKDINDTLRFIS